MGILISFPYFGGIGARNFLFSYLSRMNDSRFSLLELESIMESCWNSDRPPSQTFFEVKLPTFFSIATYSGSQSSNSSEGTQTINF